MDEDAVHGQDIEKCAASEDEALIEQQRKDVLLEQERMRRWIEDGEALPVKMACKLSQHIVVQQKDKDGG